MRSSSLTALACALALTALTSADALAAPVAPAPPAAPAAPVAPAAPLAPAPIAAKFDAQMKPVLEHYLTIQAALADDQLDAARAAAHQLEDLADDLEDHDVPALDDLADAIEDHADALSDAGDLATARAAFKRLTAPMVQWQTAAQVAGIDTVFCPMADGRWLQRTGAVKNPYHGKEMLACGEVVAGPGAQKK